MQTGSSETISTTDFVETRNSTEATLSESVVTNESTVVTTGSTESSDTADTSADTQTTANASGDNPLQVMVDGYFKKFGTSAGPYTSKRASIPMENEPPKIMMLPEDLSSQGTTMERKLYDVVMASKLPWMHISRTIVHQTSDPNNHTSWTVDMDTNEEYAGWEENTDEPGDYLVSVTYVECETQAFQFENDGGYSVAQLTWMEKWIEYFSFEIPVRDFLQSEYIKN